jgi:hypothetical protein
LTVYNEKSGDSTSTKFLGSLVNALVIVGAIGGVTIIMLLLYYFRYGEGGRRGGIKGNEGGNKRERRGGLALIYVINAQYYTGYSSRLMKVLWAWLMGSTGILLGGFSAYIS